jgi:NADH:ubiquinone oxidoreductase subunit C
MNAEEDIKQELVSKFIYLTDKIRIQRARRIFLEVEAKNFFDVLDCAIKQLKFIHLCALTGLDEGTNFGIIYHLSQDSGIVLNLKIAIPKDNPILRTITFYFPDAEIYERELMDLLGIKVDALPPGLRYPLSDDWPTNEFPLRKDWKIKKNEKQEEANNDRQA